VKNIYYFLQYYWIKNEYSFANEQQRLYVSIKILIATYLDCRFISIFNTKIIFKNTRKNSLFVFNLIKNKEINILNNENIINTNEKNDISINKKNNLNYNKTRYLLWRHIEFWIIFNKNSTKSNVFFVKIELLYTKNKKRNSCK